MYVYPFDPLEKEDNVNQPINSNGSKFPTLMRMINKFGNNRKAYMSEEVNLIGRVIAATLAIKFSCVRTTPCTYKN